jgi:hypothetical protein
MRAMKAIKVLLVFITIYFLVLNATIALFLLFQFLWENVKDSFALPMLIIASFVNAFRITRDLIKSDYF